MATAFDTTPDRPQSFGFKVCWFAIRAPDPLNVVEAFGLGNAESANWRSGLAAACSIRPEEAAWLYVASVNGWVLAIGNWLPYPTNETHHDIGQKFDALFARLSARFDDVQFFASQRVTDSFAWARSQNGVPTRVYSCIGGEISVNAGNQTEEEAKLGLPDVSGLSPGEATDRLFEISDEMDEQQSALEDEGLSVDEAYEKSHPEDRKTFPDEDIVVALAGLWSVDPSLFSDQQFPPSVGLVIQLPDHLRQ